MASMPSYVWSTEKALKMPISTLNALRGAHEFRVSRNYKKSRNLRRPRRIVFIKSSLLNNLSGPDESILCLSFHNLILVFCVYICLKYFDLKSNSIEQHNGLQQRTRFACRFTKTRIFARAFYFCIPGILINRN